MARADPLVKSSRFVVLASICIVVAALYFAQDVLIPVALALLLSFLLAPLVHRLERWRVHRIASVIIVITLALGVVAGIGYVVWSQVTTLAHDLPKYRQNIKQKASRFRPSSGGVFAELQKTATDLASPATTQATQPTTRDTSLPTAASARNANPPPLLPPPGTEENPLYVVPREPPPNACTIHKTTFGPLLGPLGTAGIVIVFTMFMLLAKEDLRDRVIRLVGGGHLTVTTQALDDAATRISRYLLMQSIVNGTYGIAIGIGLWLIGLPNPFLWGLLCAILRFIPYIGPWMGAAFPLALSLAVFPGMKQLGETLLLFVVIELLSNNVMEPWLYGSSTGMSAVAILVSAVFWTWLWGPIGLLLSTPLTVILVVIGKYVPQLQFLDILLGDEPVLAPPSRVYQRWLALDQEEAAELVHGYLKEMPLEEVYDTVVLPALALAEQDRHRGELDDRRQSFIRRAVRDLIEELGDEQRAITVREDAEEAVDRAKQEHPVEQVKSTKRLALPSDCVINVLCLPAHDEADELAAIMLTQLLELHGYCATAASQTQLAGEMMQLIEDSAANIVCVSALPPAAVTHSRYLCKRIHAKYPDIQMVVGLWTVKGELKRAKERITCVASVQLVTTLTQALDRIQQLVQPLLMKTDAEKAGAVGK